MSEEKKQKLKVYQKKYQKNYREAKMSKQNNESNSFLNNDLIVHILFRQIDGDKSLTMHD